MDALRAVEQTPKKPFYRKEVINGRLSMRYAIADVMSSACVNCHNSHPETPKVGWKVGDVRGVVEIITPIDQENVGAIKWDDDSPWMCCCRIACCGLV